MPYVTLADLKTYLGIPVEEVKDDALLDSVIAAGTSWVEQKTHRCFEAITKTRKIRAADAAMGAVLWLGADLAELTQVVNGDGTSIGLGFLETEPLNEAPYYALCWLDAAWTGTILVTGKWGYSVTPPADVQLAVKQLAAFLYRQKDAQVFDTTAQPDLGVITIPQGIPATVVKIVSAYLPLVP